VPLFFSLIKEGYGPLHVVSDPDLRLRERDLHPYADESPEDWIERAESAWLAQALYRIRSDALDEGSIRDEFLGGVPTLPEDEILRRAYRYLEIDLIRV
jgi:hypothetical protein